MKSNVNLKVGLLLFAFMTAFTVAAQEENGSSSGTSKYGHGQDSINCLRNLSIYREFARHRNYKDALPSWRWVFTNCPQSSKNIYIDGVNIMRYLIEKENNPDKRDKYVDTLMMVYDQRIQYFGERGYVLGRKGVDLLRYRRDEQQFIQEGYGYLEESIRLLGDKSSPATFVTYFTSTLSLFKLNALDANKVLANWAFIMPLMDKAIEDNPKDTAFVAIKAAIMQNFVNSGAATLTSLNSYYGPLLKARPDDVGLEKEITSAYAAINEEESPLCVNAAELLYQKESSAEAAYKLAKIFYKQNKFEKAAKYYEEAISKENVDELKARFYYELAMVNYNQNNYSLARTNAQTAIKLKGGWGDPYILIATLYAASADICGSNEFEKKTVFWVAVDELMKAKAADASVTEKVNDLISQYVARYPNTEETFFNGYTEGQSYTVGCWISQTTTVRTRK